MQDVIHTEKTAEKDSTVQQVYIMDRRSLTNETQDKPDRDKEDITMLTETSESASETTEVQYERRYHRRASVIVRHSRLIFCILSAVVGMAAGAVTAWSVPLSESGFSQSLVVLQDGGFLGVLIRRMLQCAAFLLAEYILGYFAAGGALVWVMPFVYALGTGLSAAGAVLFGTGGISAVFCIAYTAVLVCGAAASGDFSALLLSLVSGREGSVVSDGAAAYHFTMRFVLYFAVLLLLAIIESWIRAA